MFFILLEFCRTVYISSDNYSAIFDINSPKYAFVSLISEYCPHCKKVKPLMNELEYRYNNSHNVIIGMIQCQYENKLCNKFPDPVTPSFYLVKGSIDGAKQFFGSISYSEITSFIEKHISPTFVNIESNGQFQTECEKRNESSIFLLQNLNQNQMKEIYNIQKEFQHIPAHFFNISYDIKENKEASLCNFYYPTNRTICLKKEMTKKKMRKFIQKHLFPVIGPISQQLINISKETKSTFLILYDEYPFFESKLRSISSKFPDDVISAILLCSNNYKLCLKFIIQTGKGPKILMYNPSKRLIWYYRGSLDEDLILEWINQVIAKKVRPAGPGSGLFGYIGNMFDVSMERGFVALSFFVIIITIFIFVFIFGATSAYYRKGKNYHKID